MSKTCKKLLASALAAAMLITTFVSSFVVSAATTGTLTIEDTTITVGAEEAVVNFELAFDAFVEAPHELATITANPALTIKDIALVDVTYETAPVDPEDPEIESPALKIKTDGINKNAGKVLFESGVDGAVKASEINFTVTFDTTEAAVGTYTVSAAIASTDINEADIVVNCDDTGAIVVEEQKPVEPECEHENITYVSHVAPIDGGANGSITYTCTDCNETFTEEVLYDNTFKFDSAYASYQAETILSFTFKTTDTSWNGVDQTKSFAILTKDDNDDDGDRIPDVKVQYLSELTNGGTLTSDIVMTYPLAAKELNDNVARQIIVYKNGVWYSRKVGNYSFVTYAVSTLAKATVAGTEKTLIMDLLNYGTIAQTRFGYNTANPANTADASFASYSGSTNEIELVKNTRTDNKKLLYRFNSVSASFESRAEMNFAITDTTTARNPISDTSLVYVEIEYTDAYGVKQTKTIHGDEFRIDSAGNVYADFAELHATQMRQEITATLKSTADDSVQYIVYYSLEYYAASKIDDAKDGEICEALIRFGDSANAHFNK